MVYIPSLRTLTTVVSVGAIGGFFYLKDPRATAYRYVVMPLSRQLYPDAEESHAAAIELMRLPFLNPRLPSQWLSLTDPEKLLATELRGNSNKKNVKSLHLKTPIGVAAGLDKNGKAIDTLFNFGFSWVEIGSVTPEPQEGNPKPRVFRLTEDRAIINRYGFNSEGHGKVAARLATREAVAKSGNRAPEGGVLAVNLGKNKFGDEVEDFVKGVKTFGSLADALVINVSSPNTPGLRDIQDGGKLGKLLTRLVHERDNLGLPQLPQLLVKIAPDVSLDQIRSIASAVRESQVDGVIVGNTTIGRPYTLKSGPTLVQNNGGLSGPPVKPLELQALKLLRREVGSDLTIIGCGGVQSAEDAVEFARAGADFVQLYTSFAYDGPEKPSVIAQDLVKLLDGRKWSSISSK